MRKIFPGLFIIASIFLSGCSTSMKIEEPYTPQQGSLLEYDILLGSNMSKQGLEIFRSRINEKLTEKGRLASAPVEAQEKVVINITEYRMRHGATRAMLGIFAGTDRIKSTIIVKDKKSNKKISEFKVQSGNASAWGTSRGMIQDHADQIVTYLTAGKIE